MRLISFFLFFFLFFSPPSAPAESTVLFTDSSGSLVLDADGRVHYVAAPVQEPDLSASSEGDDLWEETVVEPFYLEPSLSPEPSSASPSPSPLPSPSAAFTPLQYGDSGDRVLAVQDRLTFLGYYHGKISGDYLEGTQSAVRRFQKYNDLPQTGKLDADSHNRLFSSSAVARDGSLPFATPSPVPSPTPFVYRQRLAYGSSGSAVSALQQRLSELGFYTANVSGGYYQVTRTAVSDFQRHNGLSVDGIAGKQTQELLFSDAACSASESPRPAATPVPAQYALYVDVVNQITRAYTYDEQGEYTVLVREMICSTGTAKNPTPLGTTIMPKRRARWGYFPTWDSHAQYLTRIDSANAFHSVLYTAADERTLAVSSFDALGSPASHGCVRLLVSDAKWIYDHCLEGTPITVFEGEPDPEYTMSLKPALDPYTLRELPLPAPTPTPLYARENWPASNRTLFRGKQGEDVYMLQMRLAELGYYHGSVTGGYYGGTIEAVSAFQRDHGLTVDGAAGQQTLSLLFSEAVDPTPSPVVSTPIPVQTPSPSLSPTPSASPAPTVSPFTPLNDHVG